MRQKQVFSNAKWIIICKVVQSIVQLLIGMISARYLGPSNYGLISYAASLTAFALPVMKLGMDVVLVYELVMEPDREGEILGTSLVLNALSGTACILAVSAFAYIANKNDWVIIAVCALYSVSVFFAAIEMIQYWFQYKLLSKYSSSVMLGAHIVVSIYKVFLLVTSKSVFWFAVSHSIEYGIIGVSLLIIYFKCKGQQLSFSWARAKTLISKSHYCIWSALMVVVVQNTDHIMLTTMIGQAENGMYSAAITSAGVAQFVYMAIIDSFRPLILSSKKENDVVYKQNVSRLYCVIIYMALANSLVYTIFARWIIGILYGADYMDAIPVLRILAWYLAFSYMGTIRNIWLLAEEKQRCLPAINIVGVVTNILLNAAMIPIWGACGAAAASLITQVFTNCILGFIIKPIKENNILMLNGISPKFFYRTVKDIICELIEK